MRDEREGFVFPELIELGSLHELTRQQGKQESQFDGAGLGPPGKISGADDGAGFGGPPT